MNSNSQKLLPDERVFLKTENLSVEQLDCLIGAIYDLSFDLHLKNNQLSRKDVQSDTFHRLSSWPSTSHFIFSLRQMRDAYAELALMPAARQFMTQSQIDDALSRRRSKKQFWSILGEAPRAADSFVIFSDKKERRKLQQQARAFRLLLFQHKVEDFAERQNFIHLVRSASKERARQAFGQCLSTLFGIDAQIVDVFNDKLFADADENDSFSVGGMPTKENCVMSRDQLLRLIDENKKVQQKLDRLWRQMQDTLQNAPEPCQ